MDFPASRDLCWAELEEGGLVLHQDSGDYSLAKGRRLSGGPDANADLKERTALCERADSFPRLHRAMPNFILKTLPGNKAFIQKPAGRSGEAGHGFHRHVQPFRTAGHICGAPVFNFFSRKPGKSNTSHITSQMKLRSFEGGI